MERGPVTRESNGTDREDSAASGSEEGAEEAVEEDEEDCVEVEGSKEGLVVVEL